MTGFRVTYMVDFCILINVVILFRTLDGVFVGFGYVGGMTSLALET